MLRDRRITVTEIPASWSLVRLDLLAALLVVGVVLVGVVGVAVGGSVMGLVVAILEASEVLQKPGIPGRRQVGEGAMAGAVERSQAISLAVVGSLEVGI